MTDQAMTLYQDDRAAALTVGQAANAAAGAAALADYRRRKSANTLRNHGAALASFAAFLQGLAGAAGRRPRARASTWPTSTRRRPHGPTSTARRWPRRRPPGAG